MLGGGFGSSGWGRWLSLCGPRPAWSSSMSSSMLSSPSVEGHASRDRSEGLGNESLEKQMPLGLWGCHGPRVGAMQGGQGSPEAVEVEAWSSSGWPVCRSTRSISSTSIHWLSSCLSSASRCCVAIFSRASRSISCSYSFSFLFRDWRTGQVTAGYLEQEPQGPWYCQHLLHPPSSADRGPGCRRPQQPLGPWLHLRSIWRQTAGSQAVVDSGQSLPYPHIYSVLRGFDASYPIHPPGSISLHSAEKGRKCRLLRRCPRPAMPFTPSCRYRCGYHELPSVEPIPQGSPDDPALCPFITHSSPDSRMSSPRCPSALPRIPLYSHSPQEGRPSFPTCT